MSQGWRLEPWSRADDVLPGLAARVHDPLWLLARQWQLGEFHGQDAGSPVEVHVAGEATPFTAIGPIDRPAEAPIDVIGLPGEASVWTPLDITDAPLEATVEAEEPGPPSVRERVEVGAAFVRLLDAVGLAGRYGPALAALHPFPPDVDVSGALALLCRRVPDALGLANTAFSLMFQDDPAGLTVQPADRAALADVALAWVTGPAAAMTTQPADQPADRSADPPAWKPHRLEYQFALGNPVRGGIAVRATEYPGGRLDWASFDGDGTAADLPEAEPAPIDLRILPTPVRYGGMPASRYWEMEDARIDLGVTETGRLDLGRMMLVQFATVFGTDWFVVPLPVTVGSLATLDQVVVTDTFGRRFLLERAGRNDPGWNLFSMSDAQVPGLFVVPAVPAGSESPPLELVRFVRDEMANLAWAIEAVVEGEDGRGHARTSPPPPPPSPLPPGATARYVLVSDVPAYWIPLAPEQLANQESIRLRLVPLARDSDGGDSLPRGRLLAARNDDGGRLWLFEEEVPRAGVTAQRTRQRVRWHSGQIVAWTGRKVEAGRGEASSGLRFDTLDPR